MFPHLPRPSPYGIRAEGATLLPFWQLRVLLPPPPCRPPSWLPPGAPPPPRPLRFACVPCSVGFLDEGGCSSGLGASPPRLPPRLCRRAPPGGRSGARYRVRPPCVPALFGVGLCVLSPTPRASASPARFALVCALAPALPASPIVARRPSWRKSIRALRALAPLVPRVFGRLWRASALCRSTKFILSIDKKKGLALS